MLIRLLNRTNTKLVLHQLEILKVYLMFFSASEYYDRKKKINRDYNCNPSRKDPNLSKKIPFISEEKRTMNNVYKCS